MQSSTPPPATDQLITMRMSWAEFESFLQIRGESVSPRITYLDGVLARGSFPTLDHTRAVANLVAEYRRN